MTELNDLSFGEVRDYWISGHRITGFSPLRILMLSSPHHSRNYEIMICGMDIWAIFLNRLSYSIKSGHCFEGYFLVKIIFFEEICNPEACASGSCRF